MKKYLLAAASTLLFVVVLLVLYVAHMRHFRVDVVFYAALLDVALATALTSAVLFGSARFSALVRFEKLQLVAIWLLGGYAFAISVPTVIDRSLSFYLLEKLEQRGGGIRQSAFEQVFTREYMREHRLVDVRLTEQAESGTVEIIDGCVVLTERGRRFARFSRFFRTQLLPRQRLLMGEYSDALTDPFRESEWREPPPDYRCQPGTSR